MDMSGIIKLRDDTINQIAAGEVIERPASVVKELVENSVDAGATEIEVDVVNGGKRLIKVTDNGSGIREGELGLAFEKHTTSKIEGIDDVYSLRTMGFRGEALASIAAVSKVEATSKHEDAGGETGRRIHIKGGEIVYDEKIPAPGGTVIKVMDLFFNLPARKKYLKTTPTERKHIVRTVTALAIINPAIHFILKTNKKTLLNFPSSPDLKKNLFHILGPETAREMIPVYNVLDRVRVEGFVADPSAARSTRSGQWFFVNGRTVSSPLLSEALEDAMRSILMRRKFPRAVISVEIDPGKVDVNIHPTKKEVRFEDPDGIYAALYEGVVRGLEAKGISVERSGAKGKADRGGGNRGDARPARPPGGLPEERDVGRGESGPRGVQTKLMEDAVPPSFGTAGGRLGEAPAEIEGFRRVPPFYEDYRKNFQRHDLPLLFPVGQVLNLYIVAETAGDEKSVVLIDQHALHERIMLEKVAEEYERRSTRTQELLVPLAVELTPEQSTAFDQWGDRLERMGFGIEHFGGKEYRIRYVPSSVELREVKGLVSDVIDRLAEGDKGLSLEEMEEEVLKMTACRSAIKAGEVLDRKGIEDLFSQMYRAENPYYCAHGRPTMVRITSGELEKRFKRRV